MDRENFLLLLNEALDMANKLNAMIEARGEYLKKLHEDSAKETEELIIKLKGNK